METGEILDSQITASSQNSARASLARLNQHSVWCAGVKAINEFIEVREVKGGSAIVCVIMFFERRKNATAASFDVLKISNLA